MENIETDSGLSNSAISKRSSKQTYPSDRLDKPSVIFGNKQSKSGEADDSLSWEVRGATFPHGTELRGRYKGHVYYGKVDNGAFVLQGKSFLSPSAAATTITRNTVDGWLFWDCKLPGRSTWMSINKFKNA
ncbi:MAG: DUF2924 domain-containing protein [Desulfobacterales bacterium]|nr:MAG: DUF2924 domain-containing protein [Desulfobacterales bacterium]